MTFDFHKELYYGKKNNPYVRSIKIEKETKEALIWHTCGIILKGREVQIVNELVKKDVKPEYSRKKRLNSSNL